MRSDILATLLHCWEQTGKGLQVALLEGEEGQGKSHLIGQFADAALRMPGCAVTVPSGPLLPRLLECLFGLLKTEHHPEFLSFARQTTPHLPWTKVMAPQHQQVSSLWTALHRLALRERRLGLMIENVHEWQKDQWDSFHALVAFLQARQAPVLLVLTARSDPAPGAAVQSGQLVQAVQSVKVRNAAVDKQWQRIKDWLAISGNSSPEHLPLSPLTEAEVRQLVCQQLETAQDIGGLTDWLLDHAMGHPLHTLLLLRFLRREGALLDLGIVWDFRPIQGRRHPVVAELLHLELAALKGEAQGGLTLQVLQLLALAGEALTEAQLERALLLREGELASRLAALPGTTLEQIGPEGGYRLRQPLLAEAVKRDLNWEDQCQVAGRLIGVVRSPANRARLAHSAQHPQEAEWIRQALRAAQECKLHGEVAEFASALLADEPDNVELRRTLWQAWVDLGDYARIVREGPTSDPACDIHLAHALEVQGDYRQALEVLDTVRDDGSRSWKIVQRRLWCLDFLEQPEELLAELQRHSGEEHYVLEWAWGEYERSQGNLLGRIVHMQRALELLPQDSPPLERAVIEGNLGAPLINTGQFQDAHAHLERAAALFQEVGHTYGLLGCQINLAYLNLCRGRYQAAHDQNQQLYAVADRLQDTRLMSGVLANTATCEVWMGFPVRAAANYQRSGELYDGYESARASELAQAQALAGQLVQAQQTLETPDHDALPDHQLCRARVHLLLGQYPQARQHLSAQTTSPPPTSAPHAPDLLSARESLLRCWLHRLEGDAAGALAHLERATEALGDLPHLPLREETALLRGLLAGASEQVLQGHQQTLAELGALGHLLLYRQTLPAAPELPADPSVPAARPPLFLQTLGGFGLMQQGQALPWRGRKTRELLGLLLTAFLTGTPLSRSTLALELWPDQSEKNAEFNFRKTLERLRTICGDAVTVGRDAQGRFLLSDVHADVCFFVAGLENGDLEQAFQWYAGPYLPELGDSRVTELRAVLHLRLRDALLTHAHQWPPAQILGWCEQYLSHDPCEVAVATLALEQAEHLGPEQQKRVQTSVFERFRREWGFVPPELQGQRSVGRRPQRDAL